MTESKQLHTLCVRSASLLIYFLHTFSFSLCSSSSNSRSTFLFDALLLFNSNLMPLLFSFYPSLLSLQCLELSYILSLSLSLPLSISLSLPLSISLSFSLSRTHTLSLSLSLSLSLPHLIRKAFESAQRYALFRRVTRCSVMLFDEKIRMRVIK